VPALGGARLRAVFVHSLPAQEELVNHRGVPRELVHLVPPGLDMERVGPVARPDWPALPVIGALGRLEALGGHETLLRAASELKQTGKEFKLLVVGEGPEKRRLLGLARELGLADATVFAGDLPGRAEFFETIDVFVAPGLRDGFGHDLLEAMARGLPVIATAAGNVFEQVEDGRTGLLAPPQDARALAAALLRYLDAPPAARETGTRAAAEVLDRFPIQRLVDALVESYERVAP
jgi:glycosyltransferase involved in cell wall biosynthesis